MPDGIIHTLPTCLQRVKNGNKKRHKLAIVAVANKMARYIYAILKHDSDFVLLYEDLMKLPEEYPSHVLPKYTTDIPEKTRRCIYKYSDENGVVHDFTFTGNDSEKSNTVCRFLYKTHMFQ